MLAKYAIAGLAGSALLASVAFAQNPSSSANTDQATTAAPAVASDTSSFKGNWRSSKLVGLNVYNDSNESLGSINDVLADKSGNIKAVVIGVGGFLGVGEHLVAVAFDKVKFVDEPIAYTGAVELARDRRRKAFDQHDDDRCCDDGPCRGQEESVVSGSRHAERDKGSAEGDAGVQVLDRVRLRSQRPGILKMAGRRDAARPFDL